MDRTEELRQKVEILTRTLDAIFSIQKNNLNTREVEELHRKEGSWTYIPIHVDDVLRTFLAIKEFLRIETKKPSHPELYGKKFLGAGCGIGNVLLLAKTVNMGSEFHGLEYFKETAEAARTFIGLKSRFDYLDGLKILEKDITKFQKYGNYDFTYYFHPLQDYEKEKAFELRVEDQMKVGAILIPKMKCDGSIEKDKRFEKLSLEPGTGVAWRKVKK